MKITYSVSFLFILHPLLIFSQDSTQSTDLEMEVEYEEVIEYEKRYHDLLEGQEYEYEYVNTGKGKEKNNKYTHTKAHDHSIKKMDSLWKYELYNNNTYKELYSDITEYSNQNIDYKHLTSETLVSRLKILNEKTPFNIEYNPILENVIKNYLKNRSKTFERIIQKSYYYFPMFEKELDQYQIPMEIKYLAVVESALIPRIKSSVGATGLWQFMYETGKMHHLKVNSYVDERMDPLKSTKAACQYLSTLYKIFNDWDLALAAYNSGPGNVIKAIRRAKGKKNYWNIRNYLPRETAGYLPAFIATMYLFEYAKEHGIKSTPPKYAYFETDTIKIKKKVTFNEISKAVGIDKNELSFLNPSYKIGIIPKSTSDPYSLRLPLNKVANFIDYEDQLYELATTRENNREKSIYHGYSKSKKFIYKVQPGDHLSKIALKFNTSVTLLKSWNNLKSSKIRIGQKLTIYNKK